MLYNKSMFCSKNVHISGINHSFTLQPPSQNLTKAARITTENNVKYLNTHHKTFMKNTRCTANERQTSCESSQYFRFFKCFTAKTQYSIILAYHNSQKHNRIYQQQMLAIVTIQQNIYNWTNLDILHQMTVL